jgi:DNA-binding CsgD family transcriptional regulator
MKVEGVDESTRAAILRLTMAERECLKRCLSHQTAKQMALDLGISPHAVEKRLKMARAKLGLSSSLEAARLVEALERSGQLGPCAPDLPAPSARPDETGSITAPRNETPRTTRRHPVYWVSGAIVMSLLAAAALVIGLQSSGAADGQPAPPDRAASASPAAPSAVPAAGTEAALRNLVAGLASGSPDYDKLSPPFAEVVRRDLPMTHGLFKSMGELKSMTFRGRGPMGDDTYDLVFANGEMIMSAALDAEGRMAGGMFQPMGSRAKTETALRSLVAGLASGSPDYGRLSPAFAEVVRRDLPMTHGMFKSMGELKSVTFRERGPMGDDTYNLVFANGEVIMSAALDPEGRMAGGILRPMGMPGR